MGRALLIGLFVSMSWSFSQACDISVSDVATNIDQVIEEVKSGEVPQLYDLPMFADCEY